MRESGRERLRERRGRGRGQTFFDFHFFQKREGAVVELFSRSTQSLAPLFSGASFFLSLRTMSLPRADSAAPLPPREGILLLARGGRAERKRRIRINRRLRPIAQFSSLHFPHSTHTLLQPTSPAPAATTTKRMTCSWPWPKRSARRKTARKQQRRERR